jgi:hypothetical protein
MVGAVEMLGPLDTGDVRRLFHNTNNRLIPRRIAAELAWIDVCDVVTDGAQVELGFQVSDGIRQRESVLLRGAQDVERQALRRLSADAGQFAELVNQLGKGLREAGHEFSFVD